jgi:PAS domain S-box-containing protein
MKSPRGIAFRVAATYAVVAALWILGSGWVALLLPQPAEGLFETGKGLLFVALTSLLLFATISRWTEAVAAESDHTAEVRRQLQQVVDTVPVGVLLLDDANTVTFINPAAEQLMGVSADRCVGSALDTLCGSNVREQFAASVGELLATGSIDGLELPGLEPGARPRAVIARAAAIDPQATDSGWIVALADYTEAQERSIRSQRLVDGYRLISEMAGVVGRARDAAQLFGAVCSLAVKVGGFQAACAAMRDEATGAFVDVGNQGLGPAGCAVFDSMREHGSGDTNMLSALDDKEIIINNDVASRSGAQWYAAAAESHLGSYAVFGISEGGVLTAVVALFASEAGYFGVEERRLVEALRNDLSFALDRLRLESRRLEAEDALAKSEADYRRLFDYNPQPMWVYDLETLAFLQVNDAAVEKYGYSRDQLAQMTIKDIRPTADVAHFKEHLAHKQPGLEDAGFWTHRDAAGREFPVHVFTHSIEWAGRPAELVMVEEVARVS